jgi:hypothetical protein
MSFLVDFRAPSSTSTCELGYVIGIDTETADMVHLKRNMSIDSQIQSICDLFRFGSQLSNNIDLIHLQHIWNPYIQVMAFLGKKRKIPYIITQRGMLEPWLWKKK